MAKYECGICGYIYNEQYAGVAYENLVECPICNADKSAFFPLETDAGDDVAEGAAEENGEFQSDGMKSFFDDTEEDGRNSFDLNDFKFEPEETKPEEESVEGRNYFEPVESAEENATAAEDKEVSEEKEENNDSEKESAEEFVVERRKEFWQTKASEDSNSDRSNMPAWTMGGLGTVEKVLDFSDDVQKSNEEPAKSEYENDNSSIETYYSNSTPVGSGNAEEKKEIPDSSQNLGGGSVQTVITPMSDSDKEESSASVEEKDENKEETTASVEETVSDKEEAPAEEPAPAKEEPTIVFDYALATEGPKETDQDKRVYSFSTDDEDEPRTSKFSRPIMDENGFIRMPGVDGIGFGTSKPEEAESPIFEETAAFEETVAEEVTEEAAEAPAFEEAVVEEVTEEIKEEAPVFEEPLAEITEEISEVTEEAVEMPSFEETETQETADQIFGRSDFINSYFASGDNNENEQIIGTEEFVFDDDINDDSDLEGEKETPQYEKYVFGGFEEKTEEIAEETSETPAFEETATEEVIEEVAETPVFEEAVAEEVTEEVEEAPVFEETAAEEVLEEVVEEPVFEGTAAEEVIEEVTEAPVFEETVTEEVAEDATEAPVFEETVTEEVAEEATEAPVFEETVTEEVAEEATEAPVFEETATEEVAETPVFEETEAEEVTEEATETPVFEEAVTEEVVEDATENIGETQENVKNDIIPAGPLVEDDTVMYSMMKGNTRFSVRCDESTKDIFEAYKIEDEVISNGLEDIILLPAQLNPMPLGENAKVETRTLIGRFTGSPIEIPQPFCSSKLILWGEHIPGVEKNEEEYTNQALILVKGKNGHIPNVSGREELRLEVEKAKALSGNAPVGIDLIAGRIEQDLEACVYAKMDYVILNDVSSKILPYALRRARNYLSRVNSRMEILVCVDALKNAQELAKLLAMGADCVFVERGFNLEMIERITEDLKEISRSTGHNNVHDINMADICTVDNDLAMYSDIEHV